MSNTSTSETTSVCANCGKEGTEVTNTCNKCMSVMYCNAACKKKHRHKHKKDCEEHLQRVADLHDEQLFKQPPHLEDCPICFLRLPSMITGRAYMNCCGKTICRGCIHAVQSRATKQEDDVCPFCRAPTPISDEELMKRLEKRIELQDASAIQSMGYHYVEGRYGLPRNMGKALELWHRAGELGNTEAYCNVGSAYKYGDGVEKDEKKSKHYYDIAAMRGDEEARHNLGCIEWRAGYIYRALMHWMIAATDGDLGSLKKVKSMYRDGLATKDDYAKTLRSYQAYLDDIKSDQRDEAAAAKDGYKYYESAV